jgi:hypothetical protein
MSSISSDQKKSLLLTTAIYAVLIALLFLIRFWPPYNPENNVALASGGGGGGVTVNFGDSDLGSGANYKSEVLNVKNEARHTPAKYRNRRKCCNSNKGKAKKSNTRCKTGSKTDS